MNIEKLGYMQAGGTCLQGYIDTTYDRVLEVFGKPTDCWTDADDTDGKVRIEWVMKIDGEIVTIYDWKETKPIGQVTCWHIGGKKKEAVELVRQAFNKKDVPCCVIPWR